MKKSIAFAARLLAAGASLGVASYTVYVATTWCRYGRVSARVRDEERDPLLDRFMPIYEVAERHHVRVAAPAAITLAAATEMASNNPPLCGGSSKHASGSCAVIQRARPTFDHSWPGCAISAGACWLKFQAARLWWGQSPSRGWPMSSSDRCHPTSLRGFRNRTT